MRNIVLILGFTLLFGSAISAQDKKTDGGSAAKPEKAAKEVSIESGTQIAAQLQQSLNVEKSKVGDTVVLKTTKAVKEEGSVVIQKGALLLGKVTEVQKREKGMASSHIGVLFDTLKQGDMSMPITASIVSITRAAAETSANIPGTDVTGSGSAASSTRTSAGSSGGGLLGGVGNTVGGVVNTTTGVVGGVTNTAGQTLGGTTNALGGAISGLSISQSTNADANGSSTLSLTGGNIKLEKGTTFNLAVSDSASVKKEEPKKPDQK